MGIMLQSFFWDSLREEGKNYSVGHCLHKVINFKWSHSFRG
jgi:hypothetical protein